MKTFVIRTLGGENIGYGHFYRCLSLAKAIRLTDKKINIIFLINQDLADILKYNRFDFILSNDLSKDYNIIDKLDTDLVIFDSYLGDNGYLRDIKKKTKLMLIDDNNDIYDSSIVDIIYNGNIYAKKLGYPETKDQLRLLGSKYLIMKEEYWEIEKDEDINKQGILITTGGTDEYGITIKIIDTIKDLGIKTKIIAGPGYKDNYIRKIEYNKTENMELIYKPDSLKKHISSSGIVITSGGSTVYEVLSQKTIPIIFSMADNQDLICKELNNMGVEYIGKYPYIDYPNIEKAINNIKVNQTNLKDEIFDLVNGDGARKVARILLANI